MMRKFSPSNYWVLIIILLVLAACRLGTPTEQPAVVPTGAAPESAPAEDTPAAANPESATPGAGEQPAQPASGPIGGPGAFSLSQPGTQLDLLSRYQADLQVHFTGTQNGQGVERSTHLTLSYAGPEAQVTRLETSGTNEPSIFLVAGEVAGTRFLQSASDAPCSSLVDSQNTEIPTFGDPWSELPAVYGAEMVGTETINGFETDHYTFDQRAIRWATNTTAQGELWIAQGGGFLVRYRLTMQAPLGVLSATSSGEQTWQFELNPLGEDAVLLPEGCAPVLTDFAMLPDAAEALRMPGYLSYLTSSDLSTAAEFYRQELTTAGWEEKDAFNASPERTILLFIRPILEGETVVRQELATITLRPTPAGLKVEVQLISTEVIPATP